MTVNELKAAIMLCLVVIGMVWWIVAIDLRSHAMAERIQALEQSQCAEKQHAAYRFKLCQDQLRGRE